jgi:hypothetical protein
MGWEKMGAPGPCRKIRRPLPAPGARQQLGANTFKKIKGRHRLFRLCRRLAGGDARPTDLFMLYGWTKGP